MTDAVAGERAGAGASSTWTADRIVLAVIAAHAALWTLLPSLGNANPPIDVIELLAWGWQWQLGYYKGPPLAAWLADLAVELGGGRIWPVYLLSQLCIAATFLALWQLGKRILDQASAAAAVLLLEGVYYFSFPTPEFNPIILQMPFAALLGWIGHRALCRNRLADWLLLGLIAGAGLWARYAMGAYLLPLAAFILLHPAARQRLRSPGPYLALLGAVLVFLPHGDWIVAQDFASVRYVGERARPAADQATLWFHAGRFAVAQVLALAPSLLVVLALSWRWRRETERPPAPIGGFDRAYLAMLAFGPFVTAELLALGSGVGLRAMWGAPLWCFAALFAVAAARWPLRPQRLQRMLAIWAVLLALPAAAYAARNHLAPTLWAREARVNFPGRALADDLVGRWRQATGASLRYVVGDVWPAGNVAFHGDDRPAVYIDADMRRSPWIDDAKLRRDGALIVWNAEERGDAPPPDLAARFPSAAWQQPQNYHGIAATHRIGWAVVAPEAGATEDDDDYAAIDGWLDPPA